MLDFDATLTTVVATDVFPNVTERVRSLVISPDDKLYVTTDNGEIFRFSSQ